MTPIADQSTRLESHELHGAWMAAREMQDGGWAAWAGDVSAWLSARQLHARDVLVLMPFSAHLPLARRAWAQVVGGWMPRIETTRTLAALHGVVLSAPAGALSGDSLVDRLTARAALMQHVWARDWARRDGRGFVQAVDRFVDAAHQLSKAAAGVAPDLRAAYWDQGRTLLAPGSGAGARERLLAGLALEWAAQAPAPATDVLFALRPAAWVVTSATGAEPVVQALMHDASRRNVPVLWLDATQRLSARPTVAIDEPARVQVEEALDFEDEAQRAAAQASRLVGLRQPGDAPVALIAQDRSLVRRVRALLERSGIAVADETGWKLSTTRAGAALMSLLRLARAQASFDELLEGLKSGWAQWAVPGDESGRAESGLAALEGLARRLGWTRAWSINWQDLDHDRLHADAPAARALWEAAAHFATELRGAGKSSLLDALQRLQASLDACGSLASLQADDAGTQVVEALRLMRLGATYSDDAWGAAARTTQVDLDGLIRWVDEVLEQVAFMPTAPNAAEVVITPMPRAVLRPFSAVVWPGADEDHLGEPAVSPSLLGEKAAQALGVPTRAVLREQQWAGFSLLLDRPGVYLSWRTSDGERPLGCSPLLERWKLARGFKAWPQADDARGVLALRPAPQTRPAPQLDPGLGAHLPARLNATAYEALRSCPYRFHAEVILGLREDEELEEGVDKRDYGTWLHEVLRRYHAADPTMAQFDADTEVDRLWQAAEAVTAEKGWDAAEGRAAFLPFFAAFARLARVYVQWWAEQRSSAGAEVLRMELPVRAECDELRALGVTLSGQLDRIDSVRAASEVGPRAWRVLDYKTTAKAALQARVKVPTEDTQLAFYAAMLILQEQQMPGLAAGYLSLEDRQVTLVEHPDVERSARALIAGLVDDMQRMAHGHPMLALGDAQACDYCRCRGLCRRDHWDDDVAVKAEGAA